MASAGISALNTGEQISSKLITTKATYPLQSFFMRLLQSTFHSALANAWPQTAW
jgi:hypothetical protein